MKTYTELEAVEKLARDCAGKQQQIADAAGVTVPTVSKQSRGIEPLSRRVAAAIGLYPNPKKWRDAP